MSANLSGIQHYSKLKDKDKAYIIKLSGILIASVIAGIISGVFYDKSGAFNARASGWTGLFIWIFTNVGLSLYVRKKFDLEPTTFWAVFRIAIFTGFFNYIFIWTVIFNYIIF